LANNYQSYRQKYIAAFWTIHSVMMITMMMMMMMMMMMISVNRQHNTLQ